MKAEDKKVLFEILKSKIVNGQYPYLTLHKALEAMNQYLEIKSKDIPSDADIEAWANKEYYKDGITDIKIIAYHASQRGARAMLNNEIKHIKS